MTVKESLSLYAKDTIIVLRPATCWFVTFLIGMYLELPLKLSPEFIIPGFTMLVSIPFVWVLIENKITKSDIVLFLQIVILTIASIVFTSRISTINTLAIKISQFFVSVFLGIIIFNLMSRISPKRQRRIYFTISTILLVGCFLEVQLEFVKYISDEFRSIYDGTGYNPYDRADRDLKMTGFERPKFFTSEPSLVALGYFMFSTAYLLLSQNLKSYSLSLVMNLLFILTCGSPVNFLSFIIWITLYLREFRITLRTSLIAIGAALFFLTLTQLSGTLNQILDSLTERLIVETFIPSSSLFSRLYIPYVEALPAALRYNLAFGVGYAGKDLLSTFDFANSGIKLESDTGSNAFARIFIFFGLLGGSLLLRFFYIYCRKKDILELGLLFFVWFLFNQAIGPIESPRYWAYTFLLIGVFRARSIMHDIKKSIQ